MNTHTDPAMATPMPAHLITRGSVTRCRECRFIQSGKPGASFDHADDCTHAPARDVVTVPHLSPELGVTYTPADLIAMWQGDLTRYYGGLAAYMADDAAPATVQDAYDAWLTTEVEAGALEPVALHVAHWTDSSGEYLVTTDPTRSTLTTSYGEGTEPSVQRLSRTALDPNGLSFEWVGGFGYGGEFMGIDLVCIAGTVYEVTPSTD